MNSKELLGQAIPTIFTPDKNGRIFPAGFKNNVKYWGNISEGELHSCLSDGTAKLLTMDVDIGNICSLNCPHCFRRKGFDTIANPLTHEEVVNYIKEARKLGLKEVKILGRGEPFENERFLEFLRAMTRLEIGVAVFTKGHVLGSEELCRRYNPGYSCEKLVKELKQLQVSILLGFNSFDRDMQEDFVGIKDYAVSSPVRNYVELRDSALINLVEAGFNEYAVTGEATRLAMISAPVKPENIDQIFDQYTWARMRNIYMLSCPTTVSGKGKSEYEREKEEFDYGLYLLQLEDLYTQICIWNLATGLMTLEQFKEGVSLYPGCHPCNQVAAGFYLNLSGQVNQCPGRCDESTIFCRDIRKTTLRDVWINSTNYRRAKYGRRFNWRCPARDGRSLPHDFYSRIEARVLAHFS